MGWVRVGGEGIGFSTNMLWTAALPLLDSHSYTLVVWGAWYRARDPHSLLVYLILLLHILNTVHFSLNQYFFWWLRPHHCKVWSLKLRMGPASWGNLTGQVRMDTRITDNLEIHDVKSAMWVNPHGQSWVKLQNVPDNAHIHRAAHAHT